MAKTYGQIVTDLKSAGGNRFDGYGSTFGPPPDFYGDVVAAGAFTKSVAEWFAGKKIPILLQHDYTKPVGGILEMREDDKGLYLLFELVDTADGRDAATLLRQRVIDGLSIGFRTRASRPTKTGRELTDIDLMEVSIVTWPANANALVAGSKQRATVGAYEIAQLGIATRNLQECVAAGSSEIAWPLKYAAGVLEPFIECRRAGTLPATQVAQVDEVFRLIGEVRRSAYKAALRDAMVYKPHEPQRSTQPTELTPAGAQAWAAHQQALGNAALGHRW
jgi:Escherichia/Staphylococcus phage prohead protease